MTIITDTCFGDGHTICISCPSEKISEFEKFQNRLKKNITIIFLKPNMLKILLKKNYIHIVEKMIYE